MESHSCSLDHPDSSRAGAKLLANQPNKCPPTILSKSGNLPGIINVGIEEEFAVIHPRTGFLYPGAARIALRAIRLGLESDRLSLEFPHSKEGVAFPLSIIEYKTEPSHDIKDIQRQVVANRAILAKAAQTERLEILPSGVHPLMNAAIHGTHNCCSIHIHLQVPDANVNRILDTYRFFEPCLIHASSNSPFIAGEISEPSGRLRFTPFLKEGGAILRRQYQTIEFRAFDTQIVSKGSLALVAALLSVVDLAEHGISTGLRQDVNPQRLDIPPERFEREINLLSNASRGLGLDSYAHPLLFEDPPFLWQLKVSSRFGLSSLVSSLSRSFQSDLLCILNEPQRQLTVPRSNMPPLLRELIFLAALMPLVLRDKARRYGMNLPRAFFRWVLENIRSDRS